MALGIVAVLSWTRSITLLQEHGRLEAHRGTTRTVNDRIGDHRVA